MRLLHIHYSLVRLLRRYQAQVTLLTSLLRPKYGLPLEIGTVDGMQGREKEAVIISLVRSNNTVRSCFLSLSFLHFSASDSIQQRDVGFLKEKKRLNGACRGASVKSMSRQFFLLSSYKWL
jgi:DNA polymerase alpha-associated DNA helicase A